MRRYDTEDEEKIRAQSLVGEWRRSGLIAPSHLARLESELRVDLRRTNPFFRAVLFFFTALIVGSVVALLALGFGIEHEHALAALFIFAAAGCAGFAEFLIATYRLYRFGVEEALSMAAMVLVALAAVMMAIGPSSYFHYSPHAIAGFAAGALAGIVIYLRYGYVYAALASMLLAALIPTATSLSPNEMRVVAAAGLCACFLVFRKMHHDDRDGFRGQDYRVIEVVAWAAAYFALNLQLDIDRLNGVPHRAHGSFDWFTYAMMWVLPAVGLRLAVAGRDRVLLAANVVLAMLTLATNKPYLGLERKPWDPILFGILLIGTAAIVKRWLAAGSGGERHGYTPRPILASDRRSVAVVGTASAAVPHASAVPGSGPSGAPHFGGGISGGGGATSDF